MTLRYRTKQVLRHVPGFSGLFQRAEQQARRIAEQSHEIASLNRRLADQNGKIAALQQQAAESDEKIAALRAQAQWKDAPQLEKQGLFIVGHARSGTTILLRALNACPDILLLAEANLYTEGLKKGFARWFNEMHLQNRQHAKGTYCPVVPNDDANAVATLQWLAQRFRYVGEKMAFRNETLGFSPDRFFDFHARNFFTSHYVCVIRNPHDVLKSNEAMFAVEDLSLYADSYLQNLELTLALHNTLPNVHVVFHEHIDQGTFDVLGKRLGVDLGGVYDMHYAKRHQVIERWGGDNAGLPWMKMLVEAHRQMREAFSLETLRETPHHPQWHILPGSIRAMRQQLAAPVPAPE